MRPFETRDLSRITSYHLLLLLTIFTLITLSSSYKMVSKVLENGIGLYMTAIRDGNIDEAMEKHIGDRYVQHSTGVGTGKEGFKVFFDAFLKRNPNRDLAVVRTIEDGGEAFIQVFQKLNGGEYEYVTMDMFDSDQQGRVTEHWDVIEVHVKPEETKSKNHMVEGPTDIEDEDKTDENKRLVKDFVKSVLTEKNFDRVSEFVHEDYIEHQHDSDTGSAGLKENLSSGNKAYCEMLFKIIGQGNFVATLSKTIKDDAEFATMDLYRVADGLIVEHWCVTEPVPPKEEWGNPGKF